MAGLWSLCSLSSAVWQAVKPPGRRRRPNFPKVPLPVFQGAADRSYQRRRFHRKRHDEADKRGMQLSFLMPIIRTEVARMEVTPEEILLVDRMGKRYVLLPVRN